MQLPFSILPLMFCSKLKSKLFIFFKFWIIFSLISALELNEIKKKKVKKYLSINIRNYQKKVYLQIINFFKKKKKTYKNKTKN